MKKVSDIPLRLGLARFGHEFKTTASIGDVKEDTVLVYCTEELSREYPQYKIKLRGVGEYYFFDEQNLRVICITGGVDKNESIIDALMEFVETPVIKVEKSKPVLVEQPLPVVSKPVKGEKGDKGDRGETGPRGMMGPEGPQGDRGLQGVAGEKGEPGRDGSDGVQGPQGERGEPGPQGEKGEKGDRGEKGERGDVGPQGPQGIQGPKGDKGEKGDQGIPGKKGDRGKTGSKGARGEKGSTGLRGDRGERGEQGVQGPVGASGSIGPMGPQGVAGPQGPKGDLGIASAVYPLKLDSRTISVEQKFFNDLINGAVQKHTAQGGGGGNVIIKHEGVRLSSAVKSINFTGSGISSVSSDGKNINIEITGGGGGGVPTSNRFTYADDPPESPINGDRWFESDTGNYFVYIDDGDSSQWVQIVTSGGGSQGDPGDPGVSVQDGYVNTDGDLILVLSDNTTVNVGSVIGPAGPQGLVGPQGPQGETGPAGPAGSGAVGNNDVGVMYLKNNTTPTTIPSVNGRAVVEGTIQTGLLQNFVKDPSSNSLKYTGVGGRYHIIVNFNFYNGSQDTCGFYIGHNTNIATSLDADADRISESEIYANSSNPSTQPIAGTIQTVLDLNTDDRVFFIVQNKDSTNSILIEFMKFVVTSLTAEKGDEGVGISDAVVNTDGDLVLTLSDATIVNAGYVVGPQGETGPQGIQGETGPQGIQGETGPQGIQGETGPQGIQGETGPQGIQGIQGEIGPQGIQGETGPQGIQGIQGEIGPQGIQGETGAAGVGIADVDVNTDGDLIVNLTDSSTINAGYVVGPQGETGPQGIQGIQGETGPQGIQGIQGEIGPQGPQGIQGEIGPQGPQGIQGETGPQGIQGETGPQGIQGETGAAGVGIADVDVNTDGDLIVNLTDSSTINAGYVVGPQGETGPAGAITFTSSASAPSGATYGDMWFDTTSGNIFVYITDGISDYWVEPFGPQGETGAAGVGIADVDVNTDGDLIVNLTDSSTINAGNVIGPAGNLPYSPEIRRWFFS